MNAIADPTTHRGGRVAPADRDRFDVVTIGGGADGITVATRLRRHRPQLGVAIVQPSRTHFYQPSWTLVRAGVSLLAQTQRRLQQLRSPTRRLDLAAHPRSQGRHRTVHAAGNSDRMRRCTAEDHVSRLRLSAAAEAAGPDRRGVLPGRGRAVQRAVPRAAAAVRDFDKLQVTPPQDAPDLIKKSPLANEAGGVAPDRATLQHTRFPNVFGFGDAAGTMAAYGGYISCPLTTGCGKVTPSLPLDPRMPRFSVRLLKGSALDITHRERSFAEAA